MSFHGYKYNVPLYSEDDLFPFDVLTFSMVLFLNYFYFMEPEDRAVEAPARLLP